MFEIFFKSFSLSVLRGVNGPSGRLKLGVNFIDGIGFLGKTQIFSISVGLSDSTNYAFRI